MYDLEHELRSKEFNINWEIVIGDVTNFSRMERIFSHFSPELVFHAAAYKHVPLMELNPSEAITTNVSGTKNLIDLSHSFKVQKFILISTDKAVNPTSIMGASKRIAEIYAQSFNDQSSTQFITTRFGNVLGASVSVIPLFKEQIKSGGPLTVTHGEMHRYFMTVTEAVQLVIQAGSMGKGGDVFVLDMGKPVSILELAKKMIRLSGLKVKDHNNLSGDIEITFSGLRPGEKLYEELLIGENVSETQNPMIMRAKEKMLPIDEIDSMLNELKIALANNEIETLRKILTRAVPEFKPQTDIKDILYEDKVSKIK